ncbi:MAG: hypothetical protein K8F27_07995 [Sulfuricellaceae bacterium]|nr:hypothetical protein [Sulfuricellaceae bacterium]
MLSYHTASAGTGITVAQGSPVTLHWSMTGGVQDCKGDTPDYKSSFGDGVASAWKTTHTADASGNGSVSFLSVQAPVGSYHFTCTHYDANHVAVATDSAVLTVVAPACTNGANNPTACNTCTSPLVWNGTSCVAAPVTPPAGTTPPARSPAATTPAGITPPGGSASSGTPTLSITANPTRVRSGGSSTITWNASGVTSCSVTGPGLSSSSKTGTKSLAITTQSVYTLACQTSGAPMTQTATVNVVPGFQEF